MSVDLFKQLLRAAIAAKATVLVIRADKTPSIEGPSGLSELPATTINSAQISEILEGIAPGDKAGLLAQGKSKGSLNLGAGGKVGFICTAANGSATSMHVFFLPVAEKQFEEHWVKLHSPQTSKESPPATTGNTLPPEAFSVMPAVKATAQAQATAPAAPPVTTVAAVTPPAAEVPPAAPPQTSPLPATTPETAKATVSQEIDYGAYFKGEQTVSNGENEIDRYLKEMVKRKASDLHLTGGQPVIFRADGEITRLPDTSLTAEYMRQILEPIIPPRNREEIIKINDTDFAYEVTNVGRFRVNVFRDRNGIGAVLRHIPATILTAEQLKLAPAITNFCKLHKGLVLVTGPTGSGKSTTLAAMLDLINKNRHDHILTVEDPIEFVHPQQKCLVNQREVHRHTTSFARALKAALREDPDIVLIGEMRDLETISIAIETAETGHLVFGTLHTTTAVSTVDRIIQQFPAERQEQIRMMLAGGLRGVVAQTLLKKIGGGRVAAHEILVVNDAVSAMIREGKNHMIPNHMQTQKADGNLLLNESLMNLVSQNLVTPADAYSKSVDKNTLAEMMKRKGIDTTPFELRKSA